MAKGPTELYHKDLNHQYVTGSMTCLKDDVILNKYDSDYPLVLNIEPTNNCNYKCPCCPRPERVYQLDIYHYIQIINELPRGRIMLNLHKDGEPLLHPRINTMIAVAKESGKFGVVHMNTNASLLYNLFVPPDDITFSVDAVTSTGYAIAKGTKFDQFAHVCRQIKDFIKKYKDDVDIHVKMMETETTTKGELQSFDWAWYPFTQITGMHNWSGAVDETITDPIRVDRFPCPILWYGLAINSDRTVSACNVDYNHSLVVGTLDTSIKDIWQGEKLKTLRQEHIDGIYRGACEKCTIWAGHEGTLKFEVNKIDRINS